MLIPVPFADSDDLAARWRTLTSPEVARATVLLEDASYMVLGRCPTANEVDDDDAALQASRAATLKMIVCSMVQRSMSVTPGDGVTGASNVQQTAGPFSQSVSFAQPVGSLSVWPSELKLLPCGRQAAFTIPLVEYPASEWPFA